MSNAHSNTSPDILTILAQQNAAVLQVLQKLSTPANAATAVVVPGAPRTIRALFTVYYDTEGCLKRSSAVIKSRGATILATVVKLGDVEKPLGDYLITDMTAQLAALYRKHRESAGKTRYDTPPAPATRNREVALLKKLFSFACQEGYITGRNPLSKFGLEDEDNILDVDVTPDDFDHLITFCDETIGTLAILYYTTGCRRMEIQNLKWTGFDHETGQILLLKTKTKGKKKREPIMSPEALALLLKRPRVAGSPYVFASTDQRGRIKHGKRKTPDGHPADASALHRRFQEAVTASGLGKKITWHTLRHAFCRNGRRAGLSEKVLMVMGGWATRSAFDRYGMPGDDECAEGFRRMHARFGPKRAP